MLEDATTSEAVALLARAAADDVGARSVGVDGEAAILEATSLLVACTSGKATAGDPEADDSAEEEPPLATEVLRRGRRLKAAAGSVRGVLRVEDDLDRAWVDFGEVETGEGGGEWDGIVHAVVRAVGGVHVIIW